MQRKMSPCVNILIFFFLVCNKAPVFSRSIRHENCEGCSIDGPENNENHFNFNTCRFPADDQNAEALLEETENKVEVNEKYLAEVREITEDEINYIKGIIRAERAVRCKHQLQKIKGKRLEDVIKIQPSTKTSLTVSSNITETYLTISTLTFLMNHLDSELSLAAEDCCLSYPSEIFHRLKNRILKKWYNIQDRYGDSIYRPQCNVRVHVNFTGPKGCDNIRDVIYLLLQHAREILKHSKSVSKSIISRRN